MIYKIYIPKRYTPSKEYIEIFGKEKKWNDDANEFYYTSTYDNNLENIIKEISRLSDGFTVYDAIGYWKGITEPVWVFEIVRDGNDSYDGFKHGLEATLLYLKSALNQLSMFYTVNNEGRYL